jgi:hypothetical protein
MQSGSGAPPASYLGPSADWVDDDDVTFQHIKRDAADRLIARLRVRVSELQATDLPLETVATEMRRQMAECAVDGNLVYAGELAEAVWELLQKQKDKTTL